MVLKEQFSNKKDSRMTNNTYSQESSFNQGLATNNSTNLTPNHNGMGSKSKSKFDFKLNLDKVKKGLSTEDE